MYIVIKQILIDELKNICCWSASYLICLNKNCEHVHELDVKICCSEE